jgi:hypothetical protein
VAAVAMGAGECDYISKNYPFRLILVIERELRVAAERRNCKRRENELRIVKAELESSLSKNIETLHALSQALEREEKARQMIQEAISLVGFLLSTPVSISDIPRIPPDR